MIHGLSLPEKLKKIRLANKLSQKTVASCINVSRQAYQHYESGRRTPSYQTLQSIAALYHLQTYDLTIPEIPLHTGELVSEDTPVISAAQLEQHLLSAFRSLSFETQKWLVGQAEYLVKKKRLRRPPTPPHHSN